MMIMASKGNKRHMKTITSPRFIGAKKKATAYIMKARAGRHSRERSVPIAQFMKANGIAGSTSEAKRALIASELQVNGKPVRDPRYPIGLNDVITVRRNSESYLVGVDRYAKSSFTKVDGPKVMTYKLIRKYRTKGGKLMFSLNDGSIVEGSKEGRVNDSVQIDSARKIVGLLKFEKGASCVVINGVHVGASGTIKEIREGNMHAAKGVTIESDNSTFETIVSNVMVIK